MFHLTYSFQPHYGPVVDSTSNRNEYQEPFLRIQGSLRSRSSPVGTASAYELDDSEV
jgi:hypothetical protein